jgi:lysophospholipase L1-like esterase
MTLDWTRYEYEKDGVHFTNAGASAFRDDAVAAVLGRCPRARAVWLIADSTIDHNNYDESGERTALADDAIVARFAEQGVAATVDAVRGSGFAAMSAEGQHFAARLAALRRRRGASPPDAIVFIGGWNDEGRAADAVEAAVVGACRAARACLR